VQIRRLKLCYPILGVVLLSAAAVDARPPVVAVFDVQDRTKRLSPQEITELTEYLRARVGETGTLHVVPSGRLKKVLGGLKKKSYDKCFDTRCQIEVGRELAANKSLSTHIMHLGNRCATVATLYDLRRSAQERSATVRGSCAKNDLIEAVDQAVSKITKAYGAASKTVSAAKKPAVAPKDPNSGALAKRKVAASSNPNTTSPKPQTSTSSDRSEEMGQRRRARASKTTWGYVTLGIAAATAVGAGVFLGLGVSQGNDAHNKYTVASTSLEQAEYNLDIEAARVKMLVGTIFVGTAVAAAATSAVLFLTRPEIAEKQPVVGLGPTRDGGFNLSLSGTF
jgi:hypothetical protein